MFCMNPTRWVCSAALCTAVLFSGCALSGQAGDPAVAFAGEWILEKSFGVTPPQAWWTKVETANRQVIVRSHWEEPRDGRYGLTLIGLTMPELTLDTTGKPQVAQSGPFVLHYSSTWRNSNLVTQWSTSEFMGSSFRGTWTRAVSKDGGRLTLDIDASSSGEESSRARLIFRRK
jgi:hypothetical protein